MIETFFTEFYEHFLTGQDLTWGESLFVVVCLIAWWILLSQLGMYWIGGGREARAARRYWTHGLSRRALRRLRRQGL